LTPLSRRQTKTLPNGWMTVIVISDTGCGVQYDFALRVSQTHNSANTGRHLVEVMAFEK